MATINRYFASLFSISQAQRDRFNIQNKEDLKRLSRSVFDFQDALKSDKVAVAEDADKVATNESTVAGRGGLDSAGTQSIINETYVRNKIDDDFMKQQFGLATSAQIMDSARTQAFIDQTYILDHLGLADGDHVLDSDKAQALIDNAYIQSNQLYDFKTYSYTGTLATNTGTKRLYFERSGTLGSFDAHVATAPVGSAVNFTIKKNGSSIGTGTIGAGQTSNNTQSLSTTSFSTGDYLTVDITQIGSTTAGTDLYINFRIIG